MSHQTSNVINHPCLYSIQIPMWQTLCWWHQGLGLLKNFHVKIHVIIPPWTKKLLVDILVSLHLSVGPASRVHSVVPSILVDPSYVDTSYQATTEGVAPVKLRAKFQNLKLWPLFVICNTWGGWWGWGWCGRGGGGWGVGGGWGGGGGWGEGSQNAGVLIVLV